jgi:hypothetical protein
MRYMMLVYSSAPPDGLTPEEHQRISNGHAKVMEEATRKGVLIGAEPLAPVSTATTVRVQDGKLLITDGPFTETKEHLAGYYIIDCENLDEAIEWAAKIPTACSGGLGCIEIRPMRFQPSQSRLDAAMDRVPTGAGQ